MSDMTAELLPPFDNYIVYADGRVYSKASGKFLKTFKDRNNYIMVRMYNGKSERVEKSVARLVAEAFVEPPSDTHYQTVIHKNYNTEDCRSENLAWRSKAYALRYRKQVERRHMFEGLGNKVRYYTRGSNLLPQDIGSIAFAAEHFGLLYSEVVISATNHLYCSTIPNLGFVRAN